MAMSLERIREELGKAIEKRNAAELRVKDLERKLKETEKLEIQGLVQAANLKPEELARLLEDLGYLKKKEIREETCDVE